MPALSLPETPIQTHPQHSIWQKTIQVFSVKLWALLHRVDNDFQGELEYLNKCKAVVPHGGQKLCSVTALGRQSTPKFIERNAVHPQRSIGECLAITFCYCLRTLRSLALHSG